MQNRWFDTDWNTVHNVGADLIGIFPNWHQDFHRTREPAQWRRVWHDICLQFSRDVVGAMRHCKLNRNQLCLKRDSGGWITLKQAALEIHLFVQNHTMDSKGVMPVSEMLKEMTNMQMQKFLFAFACETVDSKKHRVQYLVEVGTLDVFVRPYAIRFAYGHSETNQKFLDTARLGCTLTPEILRHIPGFFHYTTKLAASMILRDGLLPGAQVVEQGRIDLHTTVFGPKDPRGNRDGHRRLGKILSEETKAAVISLRAKDCPLSGRINPSDGICLWGALRANIIDCVMTVERDGENDWFHKVIYDSTLPNTQRFVEHPGKNMSTVTESRLRTELNLNPRLAMNHEAVMKLALSKEDVR